MRPVVGLLLACVVLTSPLGCYRYSTERRVHHVSVESSPPEAVVHVRDQALERSLGPAPVQADLEYDVERAEFRDGWWWLPAGGLVLGVVGGLLAAIGGSQNPEAILVGAVVAGPAGVVGLLSLPVCAGLASAEGDLPVEPRDVLFRAELEGYHPAEVIVPIPGREGASQDEPVMLRLEPVGEPDPEATTPPASE